jgi:peptidoglycan/xylan/chitin deacetylase (PgdA/CDA1 family)
MKIINAPILMLHHVSDDDRLIDLKPYCISKNSFLRLLRFLEENNFVTKTFKDLANVNPEPNAVMLTFDDCPKHLWDFAIAELLKRNMKATFFMPTEHIGGQNKWDISQGKPGVELMSRKEIAELHNIGMEVGSHGHEHCLLSSLTYAAALNDLTESSLILEGITGKPPIAIAFPFGHPPKQRSQLLAAANFKYGVSIHAPIATNTSLRRTIYHDGDTDYRLRLKLSSPYKLFRKSSDPIKYLRHGY